MPGNQVLTAAQMRDYMRRLIGVIPPIDFASPGAAGALPPGQPDPDNPTLMECLNGALDALNRMVRCGPVTTLSPIAVPPAQPGDIGPYYISYDTASVNADDVNEINSASWIDSITQKSTRLHPYAYYQGARGIVPFQQYQPARVPVQFQLEGNAISVIPPPMYAGQLVLKLQQGLQDLTTDADQIPANSLGPSYVTAIIYFATALVCARMTGDVEMQGRFQTYYALAQEGYQQILVWKLGYSSQAVQSFPDLWKATTLAQFTNEQQSAILQEVAG